MRISSSYKFAVAVLVAIGLVMSNIPVSAGSNGQQIAIYACEASKVVVKGYNQYGNAVTYTLNKSTSDCTWHKITGWWWKGEISITPYYYVTAEYPYYKAAAKYYNIPVYKTSDWVNIRIIPPTARLRVLWRANTWVKDKIKYSQVEYHDGYRQDCSGYTSFAWGLSKSYNTTSILGQSYQISYDDLLPGDALNSQNGTHIVIFIRWVNKESGIFDAYEENIYYGRAHRTNNITLNKATGKISIPGYTYPGTYTAIRKTGF